MPDEEPNSETGRELHELLVGGDDRAPARIAEFYLPWLRGRMEALCSNVQDPHFLDTACIDALQSYFKKPHSYAPERLSLGKYLLMAAKGDLRNAIDQAATAFERLQQAAENLVELRARPPEQPTRLESLELQVHLFLPDPLDQKVFALMAEGVRETDAYASALGIQGLLLEEQRHLVKTCKDRILKRLQRAHDAGRLRTDEDQ